MAGSYTFNNCILTITAISISKMATIGAKIAAKTTDRETPLSSTVADAINTRKILPL